MKRRGTEVGERLVTERPADLVDVARDAPGVDVPEERTGAVLTCGDESAHALLEGFVLGGVVRRPVEVAVPRDVGAGDARARAVSARVERHEIESGQELHETLFDEAVAQEEKLASRGEARPTWIEHEGTDPPCRIGGREPRERDLDLRAIGLRVIERDLERRALEVRERGLGARRPREKLGLRWDGERVGSGVVQDPVARILPADVGGPWSAGRWRR